MKLTVTVDSRPVAITDLLDALERGGIDLEPGTILDTGHGVTEILKTHPLTHEVRVNGSHRFTYQRPLTATVRDDEGHWVTVMTPNGQRWGRITDLVEARKGWRAPLEPVEITFLGLNPEAEDAITDDWRFEDLTVGQLHRLVQFHDANDN